jgi:8-hydroxy-5-deazaflavin:NADPH oxidoreductase
VKIGIVGGTGKIGEGMAMRLSRIYDVLVGSREIEKALDTCESCLRYADDNGLSCTVRGLTNQEVVDGADVIILAIPHKHLDSTITGLHGLEGKIVISPINPMEKHDFFEYIPPVEGSAALHLKKILPESTRLCVAFNNIAGNRWRDIDEELEYSVAVCGDDAESKLIVMDMIDRISLLKSYDAGPLTMSPVIEGLTALVNNIAKCNHMKDVGVRFV